MISRPRPASELVVGDPFIAVYGREATAVGEAPGRVNLIGEHTDYNDGFVLPLATPQRTVVSIAPRPGDRARVWSANIVPGTPEEFVIGAERKTGTWIDYVQGVVVALRDAGKRVGAFSAAIQSSVPLGAGLSSSASLEVALIRSLRAAFDLAVDDLAAAAIAHAAETKFVGVPVGIMDQMAAAIATKDRALFLDTRTLQYERVPVAGQIIVIDSGIRHSHAGGEYRTRRAECEEAARTLGVPALRDVRIQDLDRLELGSPFERRVRHVVTENDRVQLARELLRAGDVKAVGVLMNRSHVSMRDDYEVSIPPIDRLVAIAQSQREVLGARLTGGGFGGAIVALMAPTGGRDDADPRDVARRIVDAYTDECGGEATVLIA